MAFEQALEERVGNKAQLDNRARICICITACTPYEEVHRREGAICRRAARWSPAAVCKAKNTRLASVRLWRRRRVGGPIQQFRNHPRAERNAAQGFGHSNRRRQSADQVLSR